MNDDANKRFLKTPYANEYKFILHFSIATIYVFRIHIFL